MWNRTDDAAQKWILLFILLAAALRVAYVLTCPDSVFWIDEKEYMMLASKLVNFHEYTNINGTPTAFRPVGYPLFLSLLYVVHIKSPMAIRLAQVALSLLNLVLLMQLLKTHKQQKAVVWAVLFYAIYPYFIMLPGTVLASTWFSFLLLFSTWMSILAVQKKSLWRMLSAGLLLGAATLTRTSAGILAPGIVLWMFLQFKLNIAKTAKFAAVFSAAFLLVIAPWMLRNAQQLGSATLSTNGGRNLWLGNNPETTVHSGSSIDIPPELDARLVGKNESETDKIYKHKAVAFIRQNPGVFIKRTILKGFSLWRFGPSPTTPGYIEQNRLLRWVSYLSYGPIFLLAIVGICLSRAENRQLLMLYIFYMANFTILHGIYFSKVRFRLPLDHFLILMAAMGVQAIIGLVQQNEVNTS